MIRYLFAHTLTQTLELLLLRTKRFRLSRYYFVHAHEVIVNTSAARNLKLNCFVLGTTVQLFFLPNRCY